MQPCGVVTLPGGGVLSEPCGLIDRFRYVLSEVAGVAASFLGATQDSFDMDLGAEADDVRWFGQFFAGLLPGGQWCFSVWVVKVFARGSQIGSCSPL